MNHTELQAAVVQLCSYTGWSHLHVRRSIGRGKKWVTSTNVVGWPDLLLWSTRQPGRHIAIELKVPPDKLRPEQALVMAELIASGFEAHVITPADLEELASILRPQTQSR